MRVFYGLAGKRLWVAGHRGMVGSALVRRLSREDCEILTVGRDQLDLRDGAAVAGWMEDNRPDAIILAAARVGGILANSLYPADFLHDNLAIQTNVMECARRQGVEKLLFLGSSCIYPRDARQPIAESALMTGPLERTNEAYAIAKIAGVAMCQAYRRQHGCDFIAAMPTNLYGPGDNFDAETAHVLPALMGRLDDAVRHGLPVVDIWGSGAPRREFLHVDDAADALVHLMMTYSDETPINVGCGDDIAIADLALLLADVVGYRGAFRFDTSRPDGAPVKRLDVSRLAALGWRTDRPLRQGVEETYRWYQQEAADRTIG